LAQKKHTFLKNAEVFQNPRLKERWTGDQAVRKTLWTPALRRAGVRYRNPYQTRHTYASMMLMAGEHVMWTAKQMGHSDWTFTARTYSHWIPSDMSDAGNKAVALWSLSGHSQVSNS
jgi:integrase